MTPIEFPEVNVRIGSGQPPYIPLPAHAVPDDVLGRRITCWQLRKGEIENIRKTGVLWVEMLTFNEKLQPIRITVDKPDGMGTGIVARLITDKPPASKAE